MAEIKSLRKIGYACGLVWTYHSAIAHHSTRLVMVMMVVVMMFWFPFWLLGLLLHSMLRLLLAIYTVGLLHHRLLIRRCLLVLGIHLG